MKVQVAKQGVITMQLFPEDLEILEEACNVSIPHIMGETMNDQKIQLLEVLEEAFRFMGLVARVQTGEFTAKDIEYLAQ